MPDMSSPLPGNQMTAAWSELKDSMPEPVDPFLWAVQWFCAHYESPLSASALQAGLPREARLKPGTMLRMFERAGIGAGWVKRDLDQLSAYLFPILLLRNDGSCYIVTERIDVGGRTQYTVLMPEMGGGATRMEERELLRLYGGHALLVSPKPKLDTRAGVAVPKPQGHWFFSTLWNYRRYFASGVFATLLVNVLALASTFFIMNVYDRVVPNHAYVTLWSLAIGVTVAMLFEFLTRQVRSHVIDVAGKKSDLVLGSILFRRAMSIRMENKPQSAGSFANQLREFESVRDFFTSATLSTLCDLPFALLFVLVIYLVGGPLVMVLLVAIPLIILVSVAIQWPLARSMRENLRESSLKQGLLIEAVEGLESLKAASGEGVMQRHWEEFSALAATTAMKSRALSSLAVNFATLIQQVSTVAIVVWGVYLIHSGDLSMGALIASVMLSSRALAPLAAIVGLAVRYQQAKAALGSLNQLMAMPTEWEEGRKYLAAPDLNGDLTLKAVGFSYPAPPMQTAPLVLGDINLHIRRGEKVGVLGNIGSGKSTLLKVMAQLYRPVAGQVLMDGIDAGQIDPADWRANVGYLGQDVRLFFGSLRENVVLGNPGVSTEEFLQVARLSGIDSIAARHPRGFEMPIGEMGQGLSGGQRQLVALARCLLLKPKILLMDEPTSSMDAMTEQQFLTRMKQAIGDQTLVVVTHRYSLLELVDRLILVDDGKVMADGPKESVLAALKRGGNTGQSV